MKKGIALYEALLVMIILGLFVSFGLMIITAEKKEIKIMGISKLYVCLECHIEFKIIVESDKDEETIRDQYPTSAKAIDLGLDECPFCGGSIDEVD